MHQFCSELSGLYVNLPLLTEESHSRNLGLKLSITGEGVWRIRRGERSSIIELFKYEETGYGGILPLEFVEWRGRKTELQSSDSAGPAVAVEAPAHNIA